MGMDSNCNDDMWNKAKKELWTKVPLYSPGLTWVLSPKQHLFIYFPGFIIFLLITTICHSIKFSLFDKEDYGLLKSNNNIRHSQSIKGVS